ncbi:MAG: hypothetical protein A3A51_02860 [Candidatus Levybacteria bacterium RIFCSPLOWO2_01_FULL_39_10]|nr:MAG: hypothetical protein A3A51_02860 [Candidatus Levybacteria bacterium RIFCSPLOWO2_01_FULL_39_10]
MKIAYDLKGFTLIEVLVGISVVIIATTVVVSLITSAFRTSNKTNSIATVRQNGSFATGQISKLLKFADNFEGVSYDNINYESQCPETGGYYSYIRVRSRGQLRTIACSNSGITIDGTFLINTNEVSIIPDSCYLFCSQTANSLTPIVGIDFRLGLADQNKADLPEGNVEIDFSTRVKMRNY